MLLITLYEYRSLYFQPRPNDTAFFQDWQRCTRVILKIIMIHNLLDEIYSCSITFSLGLAPICSCQPAPSRERVRSIRNARGAPRESFLRPAQSSEKKEIAGWHRVTDRTRPGMTPRDHAPATPPRSVEPAGRFAGLRGDPSIAAPHCPGANGGRVAPVSGHREPTSFGTWYAHRPFTGHAGSSTGPTFALRHTDSFAARPQGVTSSPAAGIASE